MKKRPPVHAATHYLSQISITQLVDQCKSCVLIGYATSGLIVIVI